ncbi:MAG: META domain-containing protein [Bacteroidota bacterium]|nr:META domain-containing protein [Bacteroidota bacterium]
MNQLLFGSLLFIALNADKCNEERTDEGEIRNTPSTEQPAAPDVPTDEPKVTIQETMQLTGPRWYVLTLNEAELGLPEGAERPWIELQADQLQGFGGCNNLMGSYLLENDRLSFTEVGSTKKYCPELQATERSILDMLAEVNTYRITNDSLLFFQGTRVVATLRTTE